MNDAVTFPISLDSDLGRELIVDCVRFAEGILTEQQVRKKFRFDAGAWEALGSNEELIEKIEAEKLRRMRDGSTKREKAQLLVVKGPTILDSIASDVSASPRHRVDAIKVLDGMAANGPTAAPEADRFIIQINLGSDVLKFDKSIEINPNDIDPNDTSTAPQGPWPVIAANRRKDDGGGEPL